MFRPATKHCLKKNLGLKSLKALIYLCKTDTKTSQIMHKITLKYIVCKKLIQFLYALIEQAHFMPLWLELCYHLIRNFYNVLRGPHGLCKMSRKNAKLYKTNYNFALPELKKWFPN